MFKTVQCESSNAQLQASSAVQQIKMAVCPDCNKLFRVCIKGDKAQLPNHTKKVRAKKLKSQHIFATTPA